MTGALCLVDWKRTTEEKYRDVRAGALQHFANGLCHVAEAASRNELVDMIFVLGGDQPLEALALARKALQAQQQAACLRSEKYAKPGQSKSAYFSYKSALENLAKVLRLTSSLLDESDSEKQILSAMARQTLDKSTRLLLSDEVALEACVAGAGLREYEQEIAKDRGIAAVSVKCLKLGSPTKPPPGIWLECMRCQAKPPDMKNLNTCTHCVYHHILDDHANSHVQRSQSSLGIYHCITQMQIVNSIMRMD